MAKQGAPLWATACEMSEVWHVPPWEIWNHPGATRWINRMRVWQSEAYSVRNKQPPPAIGGASNDFAHVSGDIPYHQMPED